MSRSRLVAVTSTLILAPGEDNEFDPTIPYTIVHHDRAVIELRETTPAR